MRDFSSHQVLCLATFFALVIKKPDKEDESKSPALKEDEEFMHERMTEEELKDPEKMEQLEQQKLLCPVKPPDTDTLGEMRETRWESKWCYRIRLLNAKAPE